MESISVTATNLLKKEINALLRRGYYSNEGELIKDAIKAFIDAKPELRTEVAIELYSRGDVSLGGAAGVAKLTIEEMKGLLASKGIAIRRGYATVDELAKKTQELRKIRRVR
jgi:predicted HTH domain antitoxin